MIEKYEFLKNRILTVDVDSQRVELIFPSAFKTRRQIKFLLDFFDENFIYFTTSINDKIFIYCRGKVKDKNLINTFLLWLEQTKALNRV